MLDLDQVSIIPTIMAKISVNETKIILSFYSWPTSIINKVIHCYSNVAEAGQSIGF